MSTRVSAISSAPAKVIDVRRCVPDLAPIKRNTPTVTTITRVATAIPSPALGRASIARRDTSFISYSIAPATIPTSYTQARAIPDAATRNGNIASTASIARIRAHSSTPTALNLARI